MRPEEVKVLARSIRRRVPSRWRLRWSDLDPALVAGRLRLAQRVIDLSLVVALDDLDRLERLESRRSLPHLQGQRAEAARALRDLQKLRVRLHRTMFRMHRRPVFRFLMASRRVRHLG